MCSHIDNPLTEAACMEGEGGGMHSDGAGNSKVEHGENTRATVTGACLCHVVGNVQVCVTEYGKLRKRSSSNLPTQTVTGHSR